MKKITSSNWLEQDPRSNSVKNINLKTGIPEDISPEVWLDKFLIPQLSSGVPEDVRNLFEAARGLLIYGYFFYPIYTLGIEQLIRVANTATRLKCVHMNAPEGVNNFYRQIEYLHQESIIDSKEQDRWQSLRKLRNMSSHPTEHTILNQSTVLMTLAFIAEDINNLFKDILLDT